MRLFLGSTLKTAKHQFGRDVLLSSFATGARWLRYFLALPVLTHSLDQVQLGLWEQVIVGINIVIPWVSLQLPGALVRFLPGLTDTKKQRDTTYALLFLTLAYSILLTLIFSLIFRAIFSESNWSPLVALLPSVSLLIIMTTCVDYVRSYFRARRQMVLHSTHATIQYFGELVVIAYALWDTRNIEVALWALLSIRTFLFFVGLFFIIRQLGWAKPSSLSARMYLKFSVPLIPTSALYRLFDAGDRFLIAHFMGHAAVGTYYVSYTVASVFATLSSPIYLVLLPALAEFWKDEKKEEIKDYISDILRYTTTLTVPILVFVSLFTKELLLIAASDSYAESAHYVPALALGFFAFSLGVPGDHLLMAAGKTRWLLMINGAMTFVNISLNMLLIPSVGLFGAVSATVIGHLVYALATLSLAHRIIPLHIPWRSFLLVLINSLIMGFILHLTRSHLSIMPLGLLAACSYGILSAISGLIGKREWNYFLRMLKTD